MWIARPAPMPSDGLLHQPDARALGVLALRSVPPPAGEPRPLAGVRRVVVLRALMLGDMLCATPALRALRAGLPQAHITLVGQPAIRPLARRLSSIDDFIEFPGWPGLPERPLAAPPVVLGFLQQLRARQFDLAVQLHGSGRVVNPLVAAFGARMTAGFHPPGGWRPDADAARYLDWPDEGSEVERLLRLTDHLGLPRTAPADRVEVADIDGRAGRALDFPLQPRDRWAADGLLAALGLVGPLPLLALVHPGAQLASRRWPPERFAAVADALAARGLTVLLTGTAAEQPLTRAVARAMHHRAHDLAGCTSLWTLGALVERSAVVVSNDTGIAHIAAALRRPSVVVASGSDVRRWAPADRRLHPVLWHDLPCRPCAHADCPNGQACALAVPVQSVTEAALDLLPAPARPIAPALSDPAGAGAGGAAADSPLQPEAAPRRRGPQRRLRILTWHVHGNYLYNLSQVPHDFYLVTDAAGSTHRSGRSGVLPWGDNVHEAPVERLQRMDFDVVLYQSRNAWDDDRHRLLSAAHRTLPRIVLEHDPPQAHPTNTLHWCQDPGALLVHVTPYNALMWDNGVTPHRVIDHGVKLLAEPPWTGALARGLVVVNHMERRGRRLGLDLWQQFAPQLPLELVGMGSSALGGAGEVAQADLPGWMARHRFFFHPVRHTSLGLALIEAMLLGLPVVGLATTELVTVIDSGRNGFIDTRPERLLQAMRALLDDRGLAEQWGRAGQRDARLRFGIERFVADWLQALRQVAD
jgi:ADP-heptose:LPS heptosyltransferase